MEQNLSLKWSWTNCKRGFFDQELFFSIFFAGGLVFGIVNIVGNFGTVFCDQAYWQSSVAAKPLQVIPT